MSGGYFGYNQYNIGEIANDLERLIENNSTSEYRFSDETIAEFKTGLYHLKKAAVYTHRIDWLVSDDDGEETFIKRLKDDLEK